MSLLLANSSFRLGQFCAQQFVLASFGCADILIHVECNLVCFCITNVFPAATDRHSVNPNSCYCRHSIKLFVICVLCAHNTSDDEATIAVGCYWLLQANAEKCHRWRWHIFGAQQSLAWKKNSTEIIKCWICTFANNTATTCVWSLKFATKNCHR